MKPLYQELTAILIEIRNKLPADPDEVIKRPAIDLYNQKIQTYRSKIKDNDLHQFLITVDDVQQFRYEGLEEYVCPQYWFRAKLEKAIAYCEKRA